MVLVPEIFCTSSITPSFPLYEAKLFASERVSTTLAISLSLMLSLMVIFSNSSTDRASALVLSVNSFSLEISFPPPIFTFSLATIALSSVTVMPNLFKRFGSGKILISLSLYPITLMDPTPLIFCSFGFAFSSAKSINSFKFP